MMCDEFNTFNFSISSDDMKCEPAEAKENHSTLKEKFNFKKHRAENLLASHDDVKSAETKEGVKKGKLDIGGSVRSGSGLSPE